MKKAKKASIFVAAILILVLGAVSLSGCAPEVEAPPIEVEEPDMQPTDPDETLDEELLSQEDTSDDGTEESLQEIEDAVKPYTSSNLDNFRSTLDESILEVCETMESQNEFAKAGKDTYVQFLKINNEGYIRYILYYFDDITNEMVSNGEQEWISDEFDESRLPGERDNTANSEQEWPTTLEGYESSPW